jgi:hypothetical protein
MAIKTDGTLWGWADNSYGQSDGSASGVGRSWLEKPYQILDRVTHVVAGHCATMAIRDDNTLWSWGLNIEGQLGNGTTTKGILWQPATPPTQILDNVAAVVLDYNNGLAVKTDGTLWSWGINDYGQVGDNTTEHKLSPVKILDSVKLPEATAAGAPTTAAGAPITSATIKVTIDAAEVKFDQPPIIKDSRTLVPLRAIFEALGAQVDWDGDTQTVTAVNGDITVSLTIGSDVLIRNGQSIKLDVPAQLANGRTLVPARAVAESFDAKVEWDAPTNTVKIQTR